MNILIAEDSNVNAIMLRNMLAHEGYSVRVAASGKIASDLLQKHPEIDMLLTDISMPDMDGFELVASLRADEALQHIPVMFITGAAEPETVKRAVELGAKGYILKPIVEPSKVLAKVREVMETVVPVLVSTARLPEDLQRSRRTYVGLLETLGEIVKKALAANALPEGEELEKFVATAQTVGAARVLAAFQTHTSGENEGSTMTPVMEREFKALQAEFKNAGIGNAAPKAKAPTTPQAGGGSPTGSEGDTGGAHGGANAATDASGGDAEAVEASHAPEASDGTSAEAPADAPADGDEAESKTD